MECFADAPRTEGTGAEVVADAARVEPAVDFAGGYCGSVDSAAAGAAFDAGPFSFGPDGDVAVHGSPQRGAGLCAERGGVVDLAGTDELRAGIALEGRVGVLQRERRDFRVVQAAAVDRGGQGPGVVLGGLVGLS